MTVTDHIQRCPGTTICAKGIGSFIALLWSLRPFCLTHADTLWWDRMHYGETECLKQRCVHQQVSDSSGWLMLMHFIFKFNCHDGVESGKEAFTHRSFYTQTLLHTDAFTRKSLHTNSFTHKHFYTETLLHTEAFTHRRYYTQTLYTQTLLHTDAFTHIAILLQFLAIQPHFVRKGRAKGSRGTSWNRNFTSV